MRRVLLVALAIACASSTVGLAQSARESRPNVVLIMADDLGWADLGTYGATDIRTPNLDRLAKEGLRLTDFYANGVTCSPTRAGLVSGRYQQRYGIEAPLPNAVRAGDRGPAKQTAVRRGDWKLIVDGPHTYLFDLRRDLAERKDLAKWRQDVAQELYPLLTSWEASVDADAKALVAAAPRGGP